MKLTLLLALALGGTLILVTLTRPAAPPPLALALARPPGNLITFNVTNRSSRLIMADVYLEIRTPHGWVDSQKVVRLGNCQSRGGYALAPHDYQVIGLRRPIVGTLVRARADCMQDHFRKPPLWLFMAQSRLSFFLGPSVLGRRFTAFSDELAL